MLLHLKISVFLLFQFGIRIIFVYVGWQQVVAAALPDRTLQSTVRIFCLEKVQEKSSTGSGFVVGNSSYVVTNSHVVECTKDNGNIAVYLPDGSSFNATVILSQQRKDLAVLKMPAPLPIASVTFATVIRQQ